MPCCSAVGCSNNGKNKRMCIFPRDPGRRRLWAEKLNRDNWSPTPASSLCQDHFEADQWENKRVDGKRKLKPNAIPTIFPSSNSSKNSKKVRKTKEIVLETPEVSAGNLVETPCQILSEENGPKASKETEASVAQPEVRATATTTSQVPSAEEAKVSRPEAEVAWKHPSNGKDLKKLCDGLQETVLALRRKLEERRKVIAKLRRKLECARDIRKVFNEDQVAALRFKNGRGARWSEATIKQGLRLEMACGPRGYAALLALNYPLPSARTLRKKRQQMNLNND